jgi:Flp pilus assembly protein TadB
MSDERIKKYEQEIARLDQLYIELDGLWEKVPRLFIFAIGAPFVWYFVSLGWAFVELLITLALVGTQAYLIGLRKSENRWNREQVREDLARLRAELAAAEHAQV